MSKINFNIHVFSVLKLLLFHFVVSSHLTFQVYTIVTDIWTTSSNLWKHWSPEFEHGLNIPYNPILQVWQEPKTVQCVSYSRTTTAHVRMGLRAKSESRLPRYTAHRLRFWSPGALWKKQLKLSPNVVAMKMRLCPLLIPGDGGLCGNKQELSRTLGWDLTRNKLFCSSKTSKTRTGSHTKHSFTHNELAKDWCLRFQPDLYEQ